jgi:hypothetical protein
MMNDIFVDGIRSIAVANGVARIELLQLKRGQSQSKLDAEVVSVLLIPVASLRDFSVQLTNTLQKLNEAAKARSAEASTEAVETALENL